MTISEAEGLGLGITPIDDRALLIISTGIEWLKENTTLDCDDLSVLPAYAKLFLIKFFDIHMLNVGVASESIEGLSQSFRGDCSDLIYDVAKGIFPKECLKEKVRFYPSGRMWW